MMKWKILFLGLFLALQGNCALLDDLELKDIGCKYWYFIKSVGDTKAPFSSEDLESLFREDCKKIENGEEIARTRSEMEEQFKKDRPLSNPYLADVYAAVADQVSIVKFEALGYYTVAFLSIDSETRKIFKINEVISIDTTPDPIAMALDDFQKPHWAWKILMGIGTYARGLIRPWA